MRLKDVPSSPAYLVFHDAYDNGAMDVYPMASLEEAQTEARTRQQQLQEMSAEEGGS